MVILCNVSIAFLVASFKAELEMSSSKAEVELLSSKAEVELLPSKTAVIPEIHK